jgi:hypothetical protein
VSFNPTQVLQSLSQHREARTAFRIILGETHQHADAPHSLVLLRARCKRQHSRHAAERGDKLAPSYA